MRIMKNLCSNLYKYINKLIKENTFFQCGNLNNFFTSFENQEEYLSI